MRPSGHPQELVTYQAQLANDQPRKHTVIGIEVTAFHTTTLGESLSTTTKRSLTPSTSTYD